MKDFFVNVLPGEVASRKERFLNKYYKSQSDLWEYDNRYFLFEGVVIEV